MKLTGLGFLKAFIFIHLVDFSIFCTWFSKLSFLQIVYGSIFAVLFSCCIMQEYPWILTCSDDQTIRIWNWQSRSCIR